MDRKAPGFPKMGPPLLPDESQGSPACPLQPSGWFWVKSTALDIGTEKGESEFIPETSPGPSNTPNTPPHRDPDSEGCKCHHWGAMVSPAPTPGKGSPHSFILPRPPLQSKAWAVCLAPQSGTVSDGTSVRMSRLWAGVSQAGGHKISVHGPQERVHRREPPLFILMCLLIIDLLICSEMFIEL